MTQVQSALADSIESAITRLLDTSSATDQEGQLAILDRAIKWEALKRKTEDEDWGSALSKGAE